jgi:hypothetical protein
MTPPFLKSLGITVVQASAPSLFDHKPQSHNETSHQRNDGCVLVVNGVKPLQGLSRSRAALLPPSISVPPVVTATEGADNVDSAVPCLMYGANQFRSDSIVVAKGYYVTVHKENRSLFNLFFHRLRGDDERVAQICADREVGLTPSKLRKLKGDEAYLLPGVHNLVPSLDGVCDFEFFFLSRKSF